MKKRKILFIVVSIMFMLIYACKKQNIAEPRFYIIPDKPTINDEISIVQCVSNYYEDQYKMDISGEKITYIRYSLPRGGYMEVPRDDTVKLGMLEKRDYKIFYFKVLAGLTWNDSILEDTWTNNFSVEENK